MTAKQEEARVPRPAAAGALRRRRRRWLWIVVGTAATLGTVASASISPSTSLSLDSAEPSLLGQPTDQTTDGALMRAGAIPSFTGDYFSTGVKPEDALALLAAAADLPSFPDYPRAEPRSDYEVKLARVTGVIERSLFDDGQAAGLSDRLIMELADIFGWDIDFVLDLRQGDGFTVIYEQKYWLGQKIADGDILAAEFTNQGRTFRAIGYRGADKTMQYYTPEGVALRRTFLRTPVQFSRVSSEFSASRYHPILKTWRAHHGVDYDAPLGTPVRATASGQIIAVGWNGGYGNTVTIRHAGPYRTLYAHLARYRPGLKAGQRVAQGEIIGYVGRTGLATGPHLHYELQVNGMHRDPLTFELHDGDRHRISTESRARFERQTVELISQLDSTTDMHFARMPSVLFAN